MSQRRLFTPSEDELLCGLVERFGLNWDTIAQLLETRSPRQCRERYENFLRPGLIKLPWSKGEDSSLVALRKRIGPKWKEIAQHFPGRSYVSVKNRYKLLMRHEKSKRPINNQKISNKDIEDFNDIEIFETFYDEDDSVFDELFF